MSLITANKEETQLPSERIEVSRNLFDDINKALKCNSSEQLTVISKDLLAEIIDTLNYVKGNSYYIIRAEVGDLIDKINTR